MSARRPAGREPARVAGPSTSAAAAAAAAAAVLAVMERVLYDSDEGKGRSNRRGKRSVGSGSGSDSQAASTSSDPVQYGGRRDEGGGGLLSSDDGGSSGSSSPRLEGREVLYARELLRIAAGGRAQAGGGGGARRGGGGGDQLRAAVADSGLGRQQEPTAAFLRTWRDRKKREALRKQVVRFLVRTPAPARPPWLPRPEDHRSYSYAVYGGGPAVQYVPPPYSVHGMGPYGVYPGVVPLHGMYGAVQATPYGAHGSVATQTSPRSGGGAPVPQSPQPPQAAVSGPADAFSFDSPAAAAARQSPSPPRTGGGLGSSAGGDAAAAAGLARPSVPLSIEIPDTPPPPKSPAAPAPASSPRGPPAGHSHSSSGGGATAPLSQLTLSGWTAAAALPPPPPPSSPGLPPSASPTRSAPPSDYSGLREQQSAMSRDVGALLSRLADMRGRLGGGDDEGAKAGEGRGV
ncbi:hypothetical protein TSOC_003213 [Tetrabaena socialis]|uniref:Uncharacterized protein n=1 Tax=Tetrabaena socialis TaxID=47790 RepID=A0A2J8AC68_9CHLO|nr:hypothetical protein TSOC_003213 [Tetrabaena socialis]|eukprot:PNH10083.1 hypothetical protein TSOC_003213 [Tetrabaena socialis]